MRASRKRLASFFLAKGRFRIPGSHPRRAATLTGDLRCSANLPPIGLGTVGTVPAFWLRMRRNPFSFLPGARVGRLVVTRVPVGADVPFGYFRRKYEVACDLCGNTTHKAHSELVFHFRRGTSGCDSCRLVRDIRGERRGSLLVTSLARRADNGWVWSVHCDCGEIFDVTAHRLSIGRKATGCRSCPRKHGMANHPLYRIWNGIVDRCLNTSTRDYKNYGSRGIKMHQGWIDDPAAFIRDIECAIGSRPSKKHSIDRIDNNGHYEIGNIRWSTALEQSQNRRVLLSFFDGQRRVSHTFETIADLRSWALRNPQPTPLPIPCGGRVPDSAIDDGHTLRGEASASPRKR